MTVLPIIGLADPKIKARLVELGGTVLALSPADYGKLNAAEIEKWATVVKLSGSEARLTHRPAPHSITSRSARRVLSPHKRTKALTDDHQQPQCD